MFKAKSLSVFAPTEVETKVIRNLPAIAALAVALTIASQARADVIHFFLNQGECTGSCGTGSVPPHIAIRLQ
jgi:hypothetical protein